MATVSTPVPPLAGRSAALSAADLDAYRRDGYLVVRGLFSDHDLQRLDGAVDEHLPDRAYAPGKVYPEPAKYTLSEQCPADPDLAYIAEHSTVVDAAETLLGGPSYLTAYVAYIRTPRDVGSLMHNLSAGAKLEGGPSRQEWHPVELVLAVNMRGIHSRP